MSSFEVLTLVLAAYGSLLSSFNVWARFNDNKNRLKVKLSNGGLVFGNELSDLQLFIQAINEGSTPIYLSSCGLAIEGTNQKIVLTSPNGERPLPCVLDPHDSVQYWIDMQSLKNDLKSTTNDDTLKIRGTFRTKTGNEAHSKPWTLNFRE